MDFDDVRSRSYSQHGREEHDRIFGKEHRESEKRADDFLFIAGEGDGGGE
jgi:hypothetical protein